MKDGVSRMNVIDLKSQSQVSIGGNKICNNHHKGGITQNGGKTMEMKDQKNQQ